MRHGLQLNLCVREFASAAATVELSGAGECI